MSWRMVVSPFEFAPNATRYHPLNWLILVVGFAVVLSGIYLVRQANLQLEGVRFHQTRQLQQQRIHSERAEQAARDPLTLERYKAQRQLENLLQTPWTLLFDALEVSADVVEGRVTLLSVSPSSAQTGQTNRRVELTVAATSYTAMLAYVDAMKEVAGFTDVRLSSHSMDERIGPAALRFRVTAGWNQLKEGVFLARDPLPAAGPLSPAGGKPGDASPSQRPQALGIPPQVATEKGRPR
jgi:Tfp pilus assembly protein PilN